MAPFNLRRWLAPRALCALVLLACGAEAAGAEGDVHADTSRTLVEQRQAARAAARVAPTATTAEVARLLADPSAWVRDAALDALVRRADVAALEGLEPLLAHRDVLVSSAVAELFALRAHAPARAALERAAREGPEPTALEALGALEVIRDARSAEALEQVLDRRREPRVRGDALVALATVAPERAEPRCRRALLGRDDVLRMAALAALLRVDGPRSGCEAALAATHIIDGTDGRDPAAARLLFAALSTLRAWSAPGSWAEDRIEDERVVLRAAIDVLVERLARVEDGRPRAEVAATLAALTRAGALGTDADVWKTWWSSRRVGFVPPDELAASSGEGATRTRVRFHGLPVVSTRVVFVQDVSGGMNGALDAGDPGSPSRLAFSLDELRRVLGVLDDDVQVDVAFFATASRRAAGRLVPVGRARRALLDFVMRVGAVTPEGQGQRRSNLHDTIAALLLDDRIDTVYLLSEGGPTEGRYVDHGRVLRHLARLNVYRQVRVHGLQMTASADGARFLRALAETTGGEFHALDALVGARR